MENLDISNLQTQKNLPLQKPKPQTQDRFIPRRHTQMKETNFEIDLQNDSPDNLLKNTLLDQFSLFTQNNKTTMTQMQLLQNQQDKVQKRIQQKKLMRKIPTAPFKVLDAPDIKDDYYLNLVDWGLNDILAVCLSKSVYLLHPDQRIVHLFNLSQNDDYVTSVNWMSDTNYLATGISDGSIYLWDTETQRSFRQIKAHTERVGSLAWNQKLLTSGSYDKTIKHHDFRMQNPVIQTFDSHAKEVCGLKWSPNGQYLASGGNDNILNVWEVSQVQSFNPQPYFSSNNHKAAVKGLAWSPWSEGVLASGGGTNDRCLKLWDVHNKQLIKSIQTDSQISCIEFSKIQKEIITSHGWLRNQISIWDYNTMNLIGELQGHQGRVLHISQNKKGDKLVSAGTDERLRFWDVYQYEEQQQIKQNFLTNPTLLR